MRIERSSAVSNEVDGLMPRDSVKFRRLCLPYIVI